MKILALPCKSKKAIIDDHGKKFYSSIQLREYSTSEEAFTKVAIERKKEVVGDLKEAMIKKDKTLISFLIGRRDTYVSRNICVHVDIIVSLPHFCIISNF